MYKLKEAAKRGVAFAGAVGMLAGISTTAFPALVSADALNPLTERSLMLTSSSPGWAYTDGSNNPTYAPPGSGPNGQKTGQLFSFRVSSAVAIEGFSFQYCTTAAGNCIAPGNGTDTANEQSNLDVQFDNSPAVGTDFDVYYAPDNGTYSATFDPADASGSLTDVSNWSVTADRLVTTPNADTENNYIELYADSDASAIPITTGAQIFVVFYGNENNYITNPGEGSFFVRMNTYLDNNDDAVIGDLQSVDIIDGGVTVANVMNESIHITTKVLETMAFSVGTVNPDTTQITHGPCDNIDVNDQIQMGDDQNEYSLSTTTAYDAKSYWRLSTNSSGGATVYYSGETLTNTVGDLIAPIGLTATKSNVGAPQFGLALDQSTQTDLDNTGTGDEVAPANTLAPLVATADYDLGAGNINGDVSSGAEFAFDRDSLTSPVSIATFPSDVINCSTGVMRYIANIAPSTPAGVYTTKINYIAAPQY